MYKIALCGSPEFCIPFFEKFLQSKDFQVEFVITQNAKFGNKMKLTLTSVAQWAAQNELRCFEIAKIANTDHSKLEQLLGNIDFVLIFAFGKIIPTRWLNLPKMGWLNIHPSKLPLLRGPTPVQTALLENFETTAVSLMVIDQEMDAGMLIAQQEFVLNPHHGYKIIMQELGIWAPEWVLQHALAYAQGNAIPYEQKGSPTFCKLIEKHDAHVLPGEDGQKILQKIKAYGYVYLNFENELLKCFLAKIPTEEDEFVVNGVAPIFVQKAGGKIMHVRAFLNGLASKK